MEKEELKKIINETLEEIKKSEKPMQKILIDLIIQIILKTEDNKFIESFVNNGDWRMRLILARYGNKEILQKTCNDKNKVVRERAAERLKELEQKE